MKFEMRKYDFEAALDEIRVNLKTLELAQIRAAQLLTDESGFSLTQDTHLSTQDPGARRNAGYSELDELEMDIDLLQHLNIDQPIPSAAAAENPLTDGQDIANALKFLTERFSHILLWFESRDPRETTVLTPKELAEQFHQVKFIDRSVIQIEKQAT
jgi:hypothetical protein